MLLTESAKHINLSLLIFITLSELIEPEGIFAIPADSDFKYSIKK